jgi:signal peptidase I
MAFKMLLKFGPTYRLADFLTAVRFVVHGNSMQPNFVRDQYILVSRLSYLEDGPARGDVVVLRHPCQGRRNYIKRIIGMSGENIRVEGGRVFVNGQLLEEPYLNIESGLPNYYDEGIGRLSDPTPIGLLDEPDEQVYECLLGDGQYFVMGDNRAHSDDSRSFGPVDRKLIVGKAWIRYWPRNDWGMIR